MTPGKELQLLPESVFHRAVRNRRHLHHNPERSNDERQTANFIAEELKRIGVGFEMGIGGHGIVATLKGEKSPTSTKCIALRADMDALPITEDASQFTRTYRSKNEGIMHACGHDAHMAILIGTIEVLCKLRERFEGTVKFIFQPAEESIPSGAPRMIKAGVLEGVDAIFGLHVTPEMPVGTFGFYPGPFMASADEIHMKVIGKGGHAARPQDTINPLVMGSDIVYNLSKLSDSAKLILLSFGDIHANGATNVIPDFLTLKGTLRAFDESERRRVKTEIRDFCHKIEVKYGGKIELDIPEGPPVVVNNPELTLWAKEMVIEFFGQNHVVDIKIRMGGEDFAHYSHIIPGLFMRLGSGNGEKGITAGLHNPKFNIDEDCLRYGIQYMTLMAIKRLS